MALLEIENAILLLVPQDVLDDVPLTEAGVSLRRHECLHHVLHLDTADSDVMVGYHRGSPLSLVQIAITRRTPRIMIVYILFIIGPIISASFACSYHQASVPHTMYETASNMVNRRP